MRRRPDGTTRWLLQDQQSSGLSLSEYEKAHGIIFEELPRPSPASQRIRRHEVSSGSMHDEDVLRLNRKRRKTLPVGPATPNVREMSPEMAAARKKLRTIEALLDSPISCVVCGSALPDEEYSQLLTCGYCHGQLRDRQET